MSFLLINPAWEQAGLYFQSFAHAVEQLPLYGAYTLIVPTGRRKRELERRIVRSHFQNKGMPCPDPPCFTLEGFVENLAKDFFPEQQHMLMSDAYRLALFEEAAEKAELSFFRTKNQELSSAALQRLADILYGFRRDGITSEHMEKDILLAAENPDDPMLHGIYHEGRLRDLTQMLREYEKLIGDALLDYPALLQKVCAYARRHPGFSKQYGIIVLDGFSEFRMPELDFLTLFIDQQQPCGCFLDYSPSNGPLFGNLNETYTKLKESGFLHIDIAQDEHNKTGNHLRRWLFNTERDKPAPDFKNRIEIAACRDKNSEVDAIARYIKYAVHQDKSLKAGDFVIAMRNPEEYTALFREIFPRHELTFNITDRPVLAASPIITAFFSLLSIIENGYRLEDIQRAMQSPYIARKFNDTQFNILNFYAAAQRERLDGGHRMGGAEGWKKKLRFAMRRLENLLHASLQNKDIGLQQRYDQAQLALHDIEALSTWLPNAAQQLKANEFQHIILDLIKTSGLEKAVKDQPFKRDLFTDIQYNQLYEQSEKDARALSSFQNVLHEFVFIQQDRWPDRKQSFEWYCARLRTAVTGARFQIREKPGYGITITSLEQIRDLEYKKTILCGMNDRSFPLLYTADTFSGKELHDSEERHMRRERMQFYLAAAQSLKAPESTLLLTYSLFQEQQDLVRSPFIDALIKITNPDQIIYTMQPGAQAAWMQAFSSVNDLLTLLPENPALEQYLKDKTSYEYLNIILPKWQQDKIEQLLQQPLLEEHQHIRPPGAYSVTELDMYNECPYKYFSNRILKIEEKMSTEPWVSPIDSGIFLHSVLDNFYRELQQEKDNIIPMHLKDIPAEQQPALNPVQLLPEKRDYYKNILFRITRTEIEIITFDHPFMQIEKEKFIGYGEHMQGMLERWLDNEIKNHIESEFRPALFEIAFGGRNEIRPAVQLADSFYLQGKIDRIEINPGNGTFIIADYKSGSNIPTKSQVSNGKKMQMPLYTLAAQQILQKEFNVPQPELHEAVYYPLNNSGNSDKTKLPVLRSASSLNKPEDNSQQTDLHNNLEKAIQNSLNIAQGIFPARPASPESCSYCSYPALCRIATAIESAEPDNAEEENQDTD
jgi:ATP-dependent helicase/nuclease subunit B